MNAYIEKEKMFKAFNFANVKEDNIYKKVSLELQENNNFNQKEEYSFPMQEIINIVFPPEKKNITLKKICAKKYKIEKAQKVSLESINEKSVDISAYQIAYQNTNIEERKEELQRIINMSMEYGKDNELEG